MKFLALLTLFLVVNAIRAHDDCIPYTVHHGDTCTTIEDRLGLHRGSLIANNRFVINGGCTNLVPGQIICTGYHHHHHHHEHHEHFPHLHPFPPPPFPHIEPPFHHHHIDNHFPYDHHNAHHPYDQHHHHNEGHHHHHHCLRHHIIQAGETCNTIAGLYHLSAHHLISMNHEVNPDCTNLRIGQLLCI